MSVLPTSRRAEEFAAALNGGGRTDDPVVVPLAALATALRAVPAAAEPRAEFRTALRQRLVAVATVQSAADQTAPTTVARLREARASWRFQRAAAVVAGSAAAVTALAGVGIGASRSLPGDPFYGVKRATERVQLATAESPEAKGKRHLEFARTRLEEVRALAHGGAALGALAMGSAHAAAADVPAAFTSAMLSTLADMDSETKAGAQDLWTAFRSSGSAEPLDALDSFTRSQSADLDALLPALPTPAQHRAEHSLELLRRVAADTVAQAKNGPGGRRSGGGGSGPVLPTPGSSSVPPSGATPGPSTSGGPHPGSSPSSPSVVPTAPSPANGTVVPPIVPVIPPLPTPSLPGPLKSAVPYYPLPTLSAPSGVTSLL